MEMLSSYRGDKHEFCLVVNKFKHSVPVMVSMSVMCYHTIFLIIINLSVIIILSINY